MPGTEDLYPLAQLFPFASKSYDSDSCPVMGVLKGKKGPYQSKISVRLGLPLELLGPLLLPF